MSLMTAIAFLGWHAINGMMTLSGAWHKLRDRLCAALFNCVNLAFYAMSVFEGPVMSTQDC